MKTRNITLSLALAAACHAAPAQDRPGVEVLHWWTSGGEAAALGALREHVERQGVGWTDSPISGGGGQQAMKTLRARVDAGKPPTAVQVMGLDVHEWARKGVLADLNEVAAREGWDAVVPPAVQRFSKYGNTWIAVPINVHSYNWVWANKEVLAKAGITQAPTSWDEFVAAGHKVRQAGYVALAHGGEVWQTAMVFDSVALATGGVEFYRRAFIEHEPKAIASPALLQTFRRMTQLRGLVDSNHGDRPWNFASAMVVKGKAGFQIMGDFAKGEFLRAGLQPGRDFLCFRVPGSQGIVSFGIDNFAMFSVRGTAQVQAQQTLASAILDKDFQARFNVLKGSVPARMDVPDGAFDACGRQGMKDLAEASRRNTLVPTIAFGHAVAAMQKESMADIAHRHFLGQIDDAQAAAALAQLLSRSGTGHP